MTHEGPPLESLLRRLAETPADFLAEPALADRPGVLVAAVIGDLERRFGRVPDPSGLTSFSTATNAGDKNRLATALLLGWLVADEWFLGHGNGGSWNLSDTLGSLARAFADAASAKAYLTDPDRREEMARALLARLDLRPAGETPEQARDRLTSISAIERQRFLTASRAAEERARAIREALARKAAEESADKYTRE